MIFLQWFFVYASIFKGSYLDARENPLLIFVFHREIVTSNINHTSSENNVANSKLHVNV